MSYRTLVRAEVLRRNLHHPRWVLLDCRFDLADPERGRRDYVASHIPGARYAHLDADLSGPITVGSGRHPLPDPRALALWLAAVGVGNDDQVVAYDDTGGSMAARLWWLLRWLGHQRVALLDGGWTAWTRARYPTTGQIPQPAPGGVFRFRERGDQVVTTEQVFNQLGSGHWLLLDARTGERYRGEEEPIDPVAGHVPGSLSHPLQENLDAQGLFLAPEELARRYHTKLGARDPAGVACLCGSGVSACHTLLAMEIAGLPGAKLYAGSWSEWIRHPRRPVATGPRP